MMDCGPIGEKMLPEITVSYITDTYNKFFIKLRQYTQIANTLFIAVSMNP